MYTEIRDEPNIFYTIMVPNTLQPNIMKESHNALGHYGSTKLYNFIRRHYYWKTLCQHCNKYAQSCPGCQQVTLKEPQYIILSLSILQFPMSLISMGLLDPYHETEKGNQYALTVVGMLTIYIFMIPIISKSTDEVIKGVYSTFRGNKIS